MFQLSERELSHNIRVILTHRLFASYFYDDNGHRQTPLLFVEHTPTINAFAKLEGGQFKIGITTGLLSKIHLKAKEKNMDPAEIIRAVFGHELSHCAKDDFSKCFRATMSMVVPLISLAIFSSVYVHPLITASALFLGALGVRAKFYKQYQKNEFRCDRWGALVSSKEAMLALLEIIQENKVSWWDRFLNHFKSHPLTEARMENIRELKYGTTN